METTPHMQADPLPPTTAESRSHTQNNPTPPPHTQTQSTLAPTSEYVRYLLLALPARYIPRGILGMVFESDRYTGNRFARATASLFQKPMEWIRKTHPQSKTSLEQKNALAYNTILGVGSLALTASYSWTVYKDIKNMFSETVGDELGKPARDVTFADLRHSDNRIVQKTMEYFWSRMAKRLVTDLLFFPAAAMRSMAGGDVMVGLKGAQAFTETWNRKTTMFEDLLIFVNNKINPINGLGQPIGIGEVFDLYQHYAKVYAPERAFTGVIDHAKSEGVRWAGNQIIFERLTELMNKTYAYKHRSILDQTTGQTVLQADFALPKFIYLLGHDLIDIQQPKQTLVTIEIANRDGIAGVKQMQAEMKQGKTLDQVIAQFHVTLPTAEMPHAPEPENRVISKGPNLQLDADAAPATQVAAESIHQHQPLAATAQAVQV